MKHWAWTLPLIAATSQAAIVESVPRLGLAPVSAWSGAAYAPVLAPLGAPALASPAFLAAPSLAAAPAALAAAPVPMAAAPAAALPAAAALGLSPAAAPQSGADRTTGESAALQAERLFDGAGAARPGDEAPVPAVSAGGRSAAENAWSRASFESADGLAVAFKRRSGPAGTVPRVYSGGLALNESFDPLFARAAPPARPEYFLWTRGHSPTGWTPTRSVLDADARDLAKMIVLAARETGSPKVELALHSFGAVVFQRMVQLRAEPDVKQALKLLSGSRVVMMNGMTHYDDVEKLGGPAVEQMAQATRMLVSWLDSWEALAAQFEAMLENPFTAMQAQAWLAAYHYQRDQLFTAATRTALDAMSHDLDAPWDPAVDPIRRGFKKDLEKNASDPAWQEALLRRSYGSFALDFKTADARFLRRAGVRLELVHSLGDQLLNWQAAQLLFERLGIKTPAAPPPAGTVLTDPSGFFRATVVDADHYYPMKNRDDLARRLDP
jgi:hypothetical protein